MTPPETLTDALEPTKASVSASLVTCASADTAVPESPTETLAMSVSVIAWLRPRVWTSRLAVFVPVLGIVPSNDAFVPPATVAVMSITLTASAMPPETLRPLAFAVFVDVASTWTAPAGALTVELASTSASVSALLVTSASALLTAMEPRPPTESIQASTIAWLLLVAWTFTPADPAVTLPSTEARVAPPTSAVGTETLIAPRAPPEATSVCASA